MLVNRGDEELSIGDNGGAKPSANGHVPNDVKVRGNRSVRRAAAKAIMPERGPVVGLTGAGRKILGADLVICRA